MQVPVSGADELACKPDPVPGCLAAVPFGGHPSRPAVAGGLQRPTRRHRAGSPRTPAQAPRAAPSWPCSGWGLPSHPGHPGRWWSLTPPFHPYPARAGRSIFCGTVPRVTPGCRWQPPCPAESGLSSAAWRVSPRADADAAARPARPPSQHSEPITCARRPRPGVRRHRR